MKSSLALSWFEQVQRLSGSERAAFLQQVIDDGTVETDYLEFKGCLQNNVLLPNEKLREEYGQALSAFANTGGGVLVWGIHASQDSKGVDRAQSPALAPDAALLNSKLDVIERDVTNPPVLGVQKFPFITEGTKGFVVCLIPESRWKPHARRINGKDEYYYMRVSSHSIQADHSTLRRLFFPEYHSRLELIFHSEYKQGGRTGPYHRTTVSLHNGGMGLADDVAVLFKKQGPTPFTHLPRGWKQLTTVQGPCWRSEHAIHSGEVIELQTYDLPISPSFNLVPRTAGEPDFLIRVSARNEPPVEFSYIVQPKDIGAGEVRPPVIEI